MVGRGRLEAVIALLDEIMFLTTIIIVLLYLLYSWNWVTGKELLLIIILYIILIIFISYKLYSVQVRRAAVGPESMTGKIGITVEPLNPDGFVEIEGELWKAISADGSLIDAGSRVIVVGHRGLLLVVKRE